MKGKEMITYQAFLDEKRLTVAPVGLDPVPEPHTLLFPFQQDIVKWALKRGRAAIFADCGMGKTLMQLEWARHIPGRVIVLAPLAVADQTVAEGEKFGIDVIHKREPDDLQNKITITNYERLHKFNPEDYSAIVLDESSILKSFGGKTRKAIQEFAEKIPYRLACTATPAPNDLIELCNHSEFLNVMSGKEIIALFFKQDGNTTHNWRLKGHAREAFWKWLAQWSVALRRPSDLGYDDDGFILPPLSMQEVVVKSEPLEGHLFATEAQTLQERRQARRESLETRVQRCADLANNSDASWLVWCDLNKESEALTKAIPDAVQVTGSDDDSYKEARLLGFARGEFRVLVTKPSIAGFGMNWQHCHNVAFVGLSDSFERFYQAIRRCWRFGQQNEVNCHIITAEAEGAVVANIKRKEAQASEMFDELVKHMSIYTEIKEQKRDTMTYETDVEIRDDWKLMLGDSCERIKEIESDSVGLTVFSPPFPGMYAYTNSPRDIGNCKDIEELIKHFSFLMQDMLRATMPGRVCCVHLTQEPVFKGKDGYVGLRDFRGDCIRAMEKAGWFYYSEVTIDKNPMLKASRTKEATLLFKTLSKDSTQCRPALADYLVIFKKPGENPVPVPSGTHERWNPDGGWITSEEWCEWASPVWYRAMPKQPKGHQPFQANYPSRHQLTDGISETHVLKTSKAKAADDEKHLCPLQLGVIERCVKLWSAPGDTVCSPFAGIGSEGYQALMLHRKFVGIELKKSYYNVALENLRTADHKAQVGHDDLLSMLEDDTEETDNDN